jgi:uncharacterized protein (DUF3820 family)
MSFDPQILLDLANETMPFGRYAGRKYVDLPEAYVLWFQEKGWPKGRVGELLQNLLVIKVNGLEAMIRKLQN